jgi:MoxR-like ATPase
MLRGLYGQAKTMLADTLAEVLCPHAIYRSAQLSQYGTPEELLGAPSTQALDYDVFTRRWDRAPASAHLLFVDEVDKAGEALQDVVLSLFAEHAVRDNGRSVQMPHELIIATSNGELWSEALLDRFTATAWINRMKPSDFEDFLALAPQRSERVGYITSQQVQEWRKRASVLRVGYLNDIRKKLTQGAYDVPSTPYIRSALDFLSGVMGKGKDSRHDEAYGLSQRRQMQVLDLLCAWQAVYGDAHAGADGLPTLHLLSLVALQYVPAERAQQELMRDYLQRTLRITSTAGTHPAQRYTSDKIEVAEQAQQEAYDRASQMMEGL